MYTVQSIHLVVSIPAKISIFLVCSSFFYIFIIVHIQKHTHISSKQLHSLKIIRLFKLVKQPTYPDLILFMFSTFFPPHLSSIVSVFYTFQWGNVLEVVLDLWHRLDCCQQPHYWYCGVLAMTWHNDIQADDSFMLFYFGHTRVSWIKVVDEESSSVAQWYSQCDTSNPRYFFYGLSKWVCVG